MSETLQRLQTCSENLARFDERYREEVAKSERNRERMRIYNEKWLAWDARRKIHQTRLQAGRTTLGHQVFHEGKKWNCTTGQFEGQLQYSGLMVYR